MSAIPPLPPFRRGVSDVDPLYRSRVGRASPAVHRGSRDAQSEHQRIATQGGWITLSYRPQAPLADMKQIPVPRAKGNDAVGRQSHRNQPSIVNTSILPCWPYGV